MDRFPLLLIAAALRAVKVGGRKLWEKYDAGDNLLFRRDDLEAPTKSPLFHDLVRSSEPVTAMLADHLLRALRGDAGLGAAAGRGVAVAAGGGWPLHLPGRGDPAPTVLREPSLPVPRLIMVG